MAKLWPHKLLSTLFFGLMSCVALASDGTNDCKLLRFYFVTKATNLINPDPNTAKTISKEIIVSATVFVAPEKKHDEPRSAYTFSGKEDSLMLLWSYIKSPSNGNWELEMKLLDQKRSYFTNLKQWFHDKTFGWRAYPTQAQQFSFSDHQKDSAAYRYNAKTKAHLVFQGPSQDFSCLEDLQPRLNLDYQELHYVPAQESNQPRQWQLSLLPIEVSCYAYSLDDLRRYSQWDLDFFYCKKHGSLDCEKNYPRPIIKTPPT